jgi:5-methylcytosine-specific restriction endonuclease McrA
LLARRFPRPDVEARIDSIASQPVLQLAVGEQSGRPKTSIGPGAGTRETQGRLEPLSAASYRVQFTASSDLYAKIEQAKQLVSHALPGVDLAALMERAIDALIEKEIRRKRGADKKRKRRPQKPGSRHVAVEVADAVWQRDGSQCTFVDAAGRRCSERRFLTLEHEHPHARNGPSTVENLSLLCAAHNARSARKVFGEEHIEKKRRERAARAHTEGKIRSALCRLGFLKPQVARVLAEVGARQGQDFAPQPLLHACLASLVR